tara:strand:+ start:313 stop:558 length:246 start_codon:yes stop_codon:yes gene_type:complete
MDGKTCTISILLPVDPADSTALGEDLFCSLQVFDEEMTSSSSLRDAMCSGVDSGIGLCRTFFLYSLTARGRARRLLGWDSD